MTMQEEDEIEKKKEKLWEKLQSTQWFNYNFLRIRL